MSQAENASRYGWRLLPPLLYMAGILVLSSIPGTLPDEDELTSILAWIPATLQNLLHIPLYGLLAWLWCYALRGHPKATVLTLVICASWGVIDELYQTTVPGRHGSLTDVFSNLIGILLGLAAWRLYSARRGAGRNRTLP